MEYHAKHPAGQAKVSKTQILFPQRIGGWNRFPDSFHALLMGEIVKKGEHDGKELLDTQDALKRPFPVELDYGIEHGRITRNPAVGNDMLAGVIALRRTVPEEETQMNRYSRR